MPQESLRLVEAGGGAGGKITSEPPAELTVSQDGCDRYLAA